VNLDNDPNALLESARPNRMGRLHDQITKLQKQLAYVIAEYTDAEQARVNSPGDNKVEDLDEEAARATLEKEEAEQIKKWRNDLKPNYIPRDWLT
jgi:hypothetical protein